MTMFSLAYDEDYFLALAAKGKDNWNAWRRDSANKDVRVTFAGIDFSEAPRDRIDFSGFEFGDGADFSGCKWQGVKWAELQEDPKAFRPGRACFTGAAFGIGARFIGAAFGDIASFGGAAFGERACFDGAIFGDDASFTGAAFVREARFDGAVFGGDASFADAVFDDGASFVGAVFGGDASFADAAFGAGAGFTRASFGYNARFSGAAFDAGARFNGATFGVEASFVGAAFGDSSRFDGAAFGNHARFDDIFFKGRVVFTGESVEEWTGALESRLARFDADARGALETRLKESWKHSGSGPDRFLTISFANARFGKAVFSGRTFVEAADFTNSRFYYPPDFDNATNVARIDFTGAHIGFVSPGKRAWTKDTQIPVRLRALRKIAEETKNHDLERDLYIEERKAERGVYLSQLFKERKNAPKREWPLIAARLLAHLLWIAVMGVYWALADYGRSFVRPAAWLIASGFAFYYWGYLTVLEPLMPKTCPLGDKYDHAVRMLALGNTVPFVGPLTIDSEIKKFLFCPGFGPCLPIPPEGFQLLVIAQNLFSIILVFFIGLALRNYFRIK